MGASTSLRMSEARLSPFDPFLIIRTAILLDNFGGLLRFSCLLMVETDLTAF